jgi:hypothetical protein
VHDHATALYKKFHVSNVPLVSIDMKYKLARLSTALALATCSFNEEFDTVTVKKDHVNHVAGFLDAVYTRAGLHEGSSRERQGTIDSVQMQEIIDTICKKIDADQSKVVKILKWMALQPSFSKDSMQSLFDLKRDSELRPLVSILQSEQVIANSGRGLVLTGKGVRVVKLLAEI